MSTRLSAGRVRATYEFIKANRDKYSVQALSRVLDVAPSGYHDWLKEPLSNRAREDADLLENVLPEPNRFIPGRGNFLHGVTPVLVVRTLFAQQEVTRFSFSTELGTDPSRLAEEPQRKDLRDRVKVDLVFQE